ncbi:MAG: hypothetical protein P1V36_16775, partial [Planctomycetota bacterium]|nr:hypothetical protein [Planctomycetota bacterium]
YSVAATNSLFSGAYWAVGMSSDPSSNSDWTSFVGTVTADGAGGMDYAPTTENHEGAVTMPNHSDTFVIAANGALTTSGGSRVGAITSDGKYAYLCGEGGAGAPCTLFLFVHK